jgi:5'-methylthioadenosine phosphorylase
VLACSTDYDCWREGHEDVTAEMIVGNLLRNVEVSRRVVRSALQRLPVRRECPCAHALRDALITSIELVPEATKERLAPIISKYVSETVSP